MPKSDPALDLTQYTPVATRIVLFYGRYPEGRIITELVQRDEREVIFKASVFRHLSEQAPAATGWAAEREGDGDVNTVACLENTETSAIGRALANLGFAASARRPSREEMLKAERARGRVVAYPQGAPALHAVRERQSLRLQQDANAAHDVLDLLDECEAVGLAANRAKAIRARVNAVPALPMVRVERIEAALRNWLRRREQADPARDAG